VAKIAGIAGFNAPVDYASVEMLMLRLRTHPDELKYFNFSDVLFRYRTNLIIAILIFIVIFGLTIQVILINRKLKKLHSENKKLLLAVEQSPVSIVIANLDAEIEYVNPTFTKITGYEFNEVLGKNSRILRSDKTRKATYDEMWEALTSEKEWRGELFNRRKNGQEFIELVFIIPIKEGNRITHYLAIKQDITERKKAEKEIQQLAYFDELTGLPNRRKLFDQMNYLIRLNHREGKNFAVFMMDLDKFKAVNDTFGHTAGDDLLKQVAERITARLRESDTVARLGGDEFVVVLESCVVPDDAAKVAAHVIADLTVPFTLSDGNVVQIGASIGISFYPTHGTTPERLIDTADTALYQAKDNGRGCFAYFDA
jgi:diguanylate cyclase (GGDEF)-like protein/PAS domain S-box-containing protein